MADLWVCPTCRRTFANRNQVHTCRPLGDLDRFFAQTQPNVRATFDTVVAALGRFGPFEILPETSRIALHHRMSFAVFMPRRRWLAGHLVLAEPCPSPRWSRVTTYSLRNHVHQFRLHDPAEVDDEFVSWLGAAYNVGAQRHLGGRP